MPLGVNLKSFLALALWNFCLRYSYLLISPAAAPLELDTGYVMGCFAARDMADSSFIVALSRPPPPKPASAPNCRSISFSNANLDVTIDNPLLMGKASSMPLGASTSSYLGSAASMGTDI